MIRFFLQILAILSFALSSRIPSPSTAIGSLPTPTPGMIFSGPNDIGEHNYSSSKGEGNGIIYTCRAGHIDLGHVRSTADWTRYAYDWIYHELLVSSKYIPFKTKVDPSIFHIEITYPDDWNLISLEKRQDLAHLASVKIAQYVIFHAGNWHEILTWYGHSSVILFSEYSSAFSWDDTFSNMMGIHLVGDILLDKKYNYNKEMTIAIQSEMESLEMFSRRESISITKTVKGSWYSGWVPGIMEKSNVPGILKILYRGFDIGNLDGVINPKTIPYIIECTDEKHPGYRRPTLEEANQYGFTFMMEIEPKELIHMKILKIVHGSIAEQGMRIKPDIEIPIIMDKIKEESLERGYNYFE
jgi:hypothetical protein